MPVIPGPVDDQGNITLPVDGGTVIPLKEQTNETPPVQIDISILPLEFRVKGRLEIIPGMDPGDPLGRLLVIDDDAANQISSAGHTFQLMDMTDPDLPLPLWSGKIRRTT